MLDANFIATTVPRMRFCSAARCNSHTNVLNLLFSHSLLSPREVHLLNSVPPLPSAPCIPPPPPPPPPLSTFGEALELPYVVQKLALKSKFSLKKVSLLPSPKTGLVD